jgi:hypothetical protein
VNATNRPTDRPTDASAGNEEASPEAQLKKLLSLSRGGGQAPKTGAGVVALRWAVYAGSLWRKPDLDYPEFFPGSARIKSRVGETTAAAAEKRRLGYHWVSSNDERTTGSPAMHSDDARDHIVKALMVLHSPSDPKARQQRQSTYQCDLWIPYVVVSYWSAHDPAKGGDINTLAEDYVRPFYDAAWDLCRIGVLRPGQILPKGQAMGAGLFSGDGYSVTNFGWRWLKDASEHPLPDASRLSEVLGSFASKFGDGYRQRAAEAVRCYRTLNYLAACTMAGAAAESILLAAAIAKDGGDDERVLAAYKSQGGRGRVMTQLLGSAGTSVATQFQHASQILHYWRDEAGHGAATTISEIEAHTALHQLLRLAQFTIG